VSCLTPITQANEQTGNEEIIAEAFGAKEVSLAASKYPFPNRHSLIFHDMLEGKAE